MKKFIQNPYGAQFSALLIFALTLLVAILVTHEPIMSKAIAIFAVWVFAVIYVIVIIKYRVPTIVLSSVFAIYTMISPASFLLAVVCFLIAAHLLVYDYDSKYREIGHRDKKFGIYILISASFIPLILAVNWLTTLIMNIK